MLVVVISHILSLIAIDWDCLLGNYTNMASEKVIHLTLNNFETVVGSSTKPVVIDFWAPWCGPCRALSPILDSIAEEHDDIVVCKVDIDEETGLAEKFDVSAIPTLVFFKNGRQVDKTVGAVTKTAILSKLK
ncbi:MAG: thioredoxin [Puniceicoccales bacterium]|jgi:thioredoxin 1|nr:thioredoxin [Puniceicoccales bacterium]